MYHRLFNQERLVPRQISLAHNHAHDGFREVMPETGVSQTRVQDHGKRERQSMDFGPPRPVRRAYLAIRRDGHRVPEITSKVRPRELSGVDIVPLPFDDPVRHLRGTLEHELVAHPALLALRHVMHLNVRTADLIYTINTK